MRRKSAKELLADSFHELAEKKNADRITIQEIAENCGYSPATFYRNFKDKYDLIAWEHAHRVSEIMNRINEDYPWKLALRDWMEFVQRERSYLANLFLHTSGHDSLVRYMTEINADAFRRHVAEVFGAEKLDRMMEIYIREYCLGTVNLICEWILGRVKASPEEMTEVFEESLPQPIRNYLIQA